MDLCTVFLLSSCEVKEAALICTQSAAVFLFLQAQSELMAGQGAKMYCTTNGVKQVDKIRNLQNSAPNEINETWEIAPKLSSFQKFMKTL